MSYSSDAGHIQLLEGTAAVRMRPGTDIRSA